MGTTGAPNEGDFQFKLPRLSVFALLDCILNRAGDPPALPGRQQ